MSTDTRPSLGRYVSADISAECRSPYWPIVSTDTRPTDALSTRDPVKLAMFDIHFRISISENLLTAKQHHGPGNIATHSRCTASPISIPRCPEQCISTHLHSWLVMATVPLPYPQISIITCLKMLQPDPSFKLLISVNRP